MVRHCILALIFQTDIRRYTMKKICIMGLFAAMSALLLLGCSSGSGDSDNGGDRENGLTAGTYSFTSSGDSLKTVFTLGNDASATVYEYSTPESASLNSARALSGDWELDTVKEGTYTDEGNVLTFVFTKKANIDDFGDIDTWDAISESITYTWVQQEGVIEITDSAGNLLYAYEDTPPEVLDDSSGSYAKISVDDGAVRIRATEINVDIKNRPLQIYINQAANSGTGETRPILITLSFTHYAAEGTESGDGYIDEFEIESEFKYCDVGNYNLEYRIFDMNKTTNDELYYPEWQWDDTVSSGTFRLARNGDTLEGEFEIPAIYCGLYFGVDNFGEDSTGADDSLAPHKKIEGRFRIQKEDAGLWLE